MFHYILLILLYFTVGALFACINCLVYDVPTPPDMSEEDKNMFAIIVAFWVIWLPVKFIKRLYIAIKTLLVKNKND